MEYRLLGASGLEVSVLSFGTMTLGGEGRFAAMGNVQVEEARHLIEICIEAGVNLFDTADIYSVRQVGGSARPGAGRAPQRHRAGDQGLRWTRTRHQQGRPLAAPHPGSLRGESAPSGNRLHRSLPGAQLRLPDAARRDPARVRGSDPRRQDPLRGLLQLLGLATHEGAVDLGPAWDSSAISRSRSTIRCSPATRSTNWCRVGLDQRTGIMAWSPLQFGLLSGKFRRGQAKPSESRLNTLDAPGTIDDERLYRIVDALADIADAARGVHLPGRAELGDAEAWRGHRHHRRAQRAATPRQPCRRELESHGRRGGRTRRSQRPPAAVPLLAPAEIRRRSQSGAEARAVRFALYFAGSVSGRSCFTGCRRISW